MDWLKARLKEKSTWAGIATFVINIVVGFGITITPELQAAILTAVNGIAGVALVMTQAKA
jgi:uncharacterized membrane protein